MDRRRVLLFLASSAVPGVAGCQSLSPGGTAERIRSPQGTDDQTTDERSTTDSPSTADGEPTSPVLEVEPSVGLEPRLTNLASPTDMAFLPGRPGPAGYITEQSGEILLYDGVQTSDTSVLELPVLDDGIEQGLLGIALHPNFATNRRLFVRHSAPLAANDGPSNHVELLVEYRATTDMTAIDPGSRKELLAVPQPSSYHNSGKIIFGPDGYLYVAFGDGGGNTRAAQDVTNNLRGSILRIDVDDRSNGKEYAIPSDNPLVGTPGHGELYAWGFRNPWGVSFDGTRLFVADVGPQSYEEVSIVEKGGNYGWPIKLGVGCRGGDDCPTESKRGEPLLDPTIVYSHELTQGRGGAIIGGHVYRGSELSNLGGACVFGDIRGYLFAATKPAARAELWPITVLDAGIDELDHQNVVSIVEGPDQELWAFISSVYGDGTSAGLYRLSATG